MKKISMIAAYKIGYVAKEALKALQIVNEKMKELDDSLSNQEWINRYVDKFDFEPEKKKLIKEKLLAVEPTLGFEEQVDEGFRIAKEVFSDN